MIKQAVENLVNDCVLSILPENTIILRASKSLFGHYLFNLTGVVNKMKVDGADLVEKLCIALNTNALIKVANGVLAPQGNNKFMINVVVNSPKIDHELSLIGPNYGKNVVGSPEFVLVEYVSANPTGPLHLGHARWAAIGSGLSNLLAWAGHDVDQEFYINDAGNQITKLGESLMALMNGNEVPENGYKGDYMNDLVAPAKHFGCNDLESISLFASSALLNKQQESLGLFGVDFDFWQSEKGLISHIKKVLSKLMDTGYTEIRDGAVFFLSTKFGDSEDRVLVKNDGSFTYFLSDIAYHDLKFFKGYSKLINIWGADHHGHVIRLKGALKALGHDESQLEVCLGQLVNLSGKSMSKREGTMVYLQDMLDAVGSDALKYSLQSVSINRELSVDPEKIVEKNSSNPIYYIQYAHARISSILARAGDVGTKLEYDLMNKEEQDIAMMLIQFPEIIELAAHKYELYHLSNYLLDLASAFHSYYAKNQIIGSDMEQNRLGLILAVKQIIFNGLSILGISAPEKM